MIKVELTPSEVTALKELAAAGPRGRKSRAVRRDLARLIQARYVTEQLESMDTVVYAITDHGRRALIQSGVVFAIPQTLSLHDRESSVSCCRWT